MVFVECLSILLDDYMARRAVFEVGFDDEVPAVSEMSMTPDRTKLGVHSEGGLVSILRREGEGVLDARLVQEVQSGAKEIQSRVDVQRGNIDLDKVTGHHRILLTQVGKFTITMVKDRSQELCQRIIGRLSRCWS